MEISLHPDPREAARLYEKVTDTLECITSLYKILSRAVIPVTADKLKAVYLGLLDPEPNASQQSNAPKKKTICKVLNYKYSKFAALVKC